MDVRGLVVLIIATGTMVMLVAGIIGAAFWGKSLTGAAVEALSTVLGMLIGIVATYVAQNYTKGEARTKPEESAPVAAQPPSQPPPPDKGDVHESNDSNV